MESRLQKRSEKLKWLLRTMVLTSAVLFLIHRIYPIQNRETESYLLLQIEKLKYFYNDHPNYSLTIIMVIHFLASFFCLPACSIINIGAGFLMGFWRGVESIYFITMVSAIAGYYWGRTFYAKRWGLFLRQLLPKKNSEIKSVGFFYLIILRLSPLIPFGLLNFSLGSIKVPLDLYLATTFAGVFFDVVLLNKIGDSIRKMSEVSNNEYHFISEIFVVIVLFILLIFSKKYNLFKFKNCSKETRNCK